LPRSASPTLRRLELGTLLKALRNERGFTVEQTGEQLGFSPSKVSRLENGLRGASARDINDLCDLYDVQGEKRQQLLDLAAAGKQQAWWQSRNLAYSNYVGLEDAAAAIKDFGVGVIPGLLQTADYARAVMTARIPRLSTGDINQRVAGRIERQRLLTAETPPQLDVVLDEAVLHRVAGNRGVMHAQMNRLLHVSELPRVDIRVLPYDAGIPPVVTSKFILLSFDESSVPGVVFVEMHTGDLYLGPADGLADYEEAFQAIQAMAATPDRTRQIISGIAAEMAD
jgi:transcriptional regulator with XRE-family HTH domain